MAVTFTQEDRRLYLTGNTYPIKEQLQNLKAHWDRDRKQWWIGSGKKQELEQLLQTVNASGTAGQPDSSKVDENTRVYGRVEYTSKSGSRKTYFVIAKTRDEARLRLTVLNGSISFWANASACRWVKRYELLDGRHGHSQYQTLGSLSRYVERSKRDRAEGKELCAECGRPGDLVEDLEDGLLKHRSCCDIPGS